MNRIYITTVDKPYGEFTNEAPFPVRLDDKTWPTVVHYYHAQKFTSPQVVEFLRRRTTEQVKLIARKIAYRVRNKWNEYRDEVMLKALRAKFSQHLDLEDMLLASGDTDLVYQTKSDIYWGVGESGEGKNRFGEMLMRVRREARSRRIQFVPYLDSRDLDGWLMACQLVNPIGQMADLYWEAGDLESAEKCYRRLMTLNGKPHSDRLALIKLCNEQGKWRSALYHIRKFRRQHGDGIKADIALAETYLVKSNDPDGYYDLQNAVEVAGDISQLHYLLARAFEEGGDLQAAYRHYKRALEETLKRVDDEDEDNDENWMLR